MRLASLLVSFATLFAACSGGAGPETPHLYEVVLLATHDGQPWTSPLGLNGVGEAVGYAGPAAYDPECLAVHADASGTIHALPGAGEPGFAFAINDLGLVCGEAGRRACVWEDGLHHELQAPPGTFSGSAHAATSDGLIVGSYGDHDEIGPRHCYWPDRDAEPVLLPAFVAGDHRGTAWAVNAAGQIAGVGGGFEVTFFAVRWDGVGAEPVRIGPLPGAGNSEARAINGDGDVAGRSSFADGRIQAFLHVRATDTLSALPFLPGGGTYGEAFGINDEGDVVGTARAGPGLVHAVLWRGGVARDLNDLVDLPPGVAYLSSAVAINDAGRIAAEAVMQDGQRRIAILLPVASGD